MSKHTSNLSENDLSSRKHLLKQMARDLQSLQLRELQYENQIIEEKKERDSHLGILKEELKVVKERDEYIKNHKKSHLSSSRSSDSHAEEESLRINYYYQPMPRRTRREIPKLELGLTYLIFMERKMLKSIYIGK